MKKTLLLAGVASLFAMNVNAIEFNPYVSAKLTSSKIDTDYKWSDTSGQGETYNQDDTVLGASFAVGVSAPTSFGAVRTELEYSKNQDAEDEIAGIIDTTVETESLMANAYIDIDTGTKFTPYVGGGIGYAKVKGSIKEPIYGYEGSMDDTNFAWQVGLGVSYAVNNNVSLDAGYRYVDFGDFTETDEDEKNTLDVNASEFYIGARYTF